MVFYKSVPIQLDLMRVPSLLPQADTETWCNKFPIDSHSAGHHLVHLQSSSFGTCRWKETGCLQVSHTHHLAFHIRKENFNASRNDYIKTMRSLLIMKNIFSFLFLSSNSVLGAGLFSLGSVLSWAIVRSYISRSECLGTLLGLASGYAIARLGYEYLKHVDSLVTGSRRPAVE